MATTTEIANHMMSEVMPGAQVFDGLTGPKKVAPCVGEVCFECGDVEDSPCTRCGRHCPSDMSFPLLDMYYHDVGREDFMLLLAESDRTDVLDRVSYRAFREWTVRVSGYVVPVQYIAMVFAAYEHGLYPHPGEGDEATPWGGGYLVTQLEPDPRDRPFLVPLDGYYALRRVRYSIGEIGAFDNPGAPDPPGMLLVSGPGQTFDPLFVLPPRSILAKRKAEAYLQAKEKMRTVVAKKKHRRKLARVRWDDEESAVREAEMMFEDAEDVQMWDAEEVFRNMKVIGGAPPPRPEEIPTLNALAGIVQAMGSALPEAAVGVVYTRAVKAVATRLLGESLGEEATASLIAADNRKGALGVRAQLSEVLWSCAAEGSLRPLYDPSYVSLVRLLVYLEQAEIGRAHV